MSDDRRLIEDYLPIEAISAEASREKSVRKGHISTLHLWWARRPLVACRAAVYGALVPASQFFPSGATDETRKSLGRANAAKFVSRLCRYPSGSKPEQKADIERAVKEAQGHILAAHAERLSREIEDWKAGTAGKPGWVDEFKFSGEKVAEADIREGRAPRPRVLDMFAGGGAIPLEALRLGCEAYANDLNPVAHIIQLCTLVYPQKYGKPDPDAKGMTGPNGTWGSLADEVRYWGNWVLKKVKAEIGDLYPLIPDPAHKGKKTALQPDWFKEHESDDVPAGYLIPVAYLWTRTVKCKNPVCGATVPLVKQTWLCKKDGRHVAMKIVAPRGKKEVRFEVVEARNERGLGFDPSAFSTGGNAACPFCKTVADSDHVKAEGCAGRLAYQFMAAAATRPGSQGKVYLDTATLPSDLHPNQELIQRRLSQVLTHSKLPALTEAIEINPRSMDVDRAGLVNWSQVFSPRQQLTLMSLCATLQSASLEMKAAGLSPEHTKAVVTLLGCGISKFADFCSMLCMFNYTGGRGVKNSFPQQSLPMVWDCAETNPFNPDGASWIAVLEDNPAVIEELAKIRQAGNVSRGSAVSFPFAEGCLDAVITDPPYYDNVSYSNLSDFFLLWLRRSVGSLYPEHFAAPASPKKQEIIAASYRHAGNKDKARRFYETEMEKAFQEAGRLLKPQGQMTVVYAHKTTLGWATLVDALRRAGFTVSEAWPLDTERKGRVIAMGTAALASSIFLVARKRDAASKTGNYEADVVPELGSIVRERVETLWDMGISGADLVIACVGAGLRAFTRFARVEYANGEEVPAERFLSEVEAVVLETILGKLSKTVGAKAETTLSGLDPATRFYVLWRYTYGGAELDAGEAIIFANGTHVELDGADGISQGADAILKKAKGKYRLLDFTDRGDDEDLGLSDDEANAPPLVDTLHRLLWLLENRPPLIPEFLSDSGANLEQLRLVAQALAGPALKGGELADVSPTAELSALAKLLANWNAVMEGKTATADRQKGQERLL